MQNPLGVERCSKPRGLGCSESGSRSALKARNAFSKTSMALTLHPDGKITTDTVDEMLLLKQRLDGQSHSQIAVGRPAVSSSVPKASKPAPDQRAIAASLFLNAIAGSPTKGVPAASIYAVLGVTESPRGLGGKLLSIKGVLSRLGYQDASVVFSSARGAHGPVWKAGPRLKEAQQKLREQESV